VPKTINVQKNFFANFPKIGRQYGRTLGLMLAIVAGIFVPQAAVFSGLIQYLVFGMMFLSFVNLKFERSALRFSLLNVLVANVCVALVAFFVLQPVDETLALVGFMTGISPTAISAPVVMALLERRVDYVVAAVLLTNISMALIVPFLLPWLGGNQVHVSIWEVLQSVAVVVILPLVLARLVRYLPQPAQQQKHCASPQTGHRIVVADRGSDKEKLGDESGQGRSRGALQRRL